MRATLFLLTSASLLLAAMQGGKGSGPPGQLSAIEFAIAPSAPLEAFSAPDLAVDHDARVWTAFLAQRVGGEQVLVAEIYPRRTEPVALTPRLGTYFPPRIAAGPESVHVVWSTLVDGNGELWWSESSSETWSAPERVDAGLGGSLPSIAVDARGVVWLTWAAFRGDRLDVFARCRGPDGWEEPVRVTDHDSSDAEPCIAVDGKGGVWTAWTSWRGGTYASGDHEIFARRLAPDFGEPLRISRTPGPDHRPEWVRSGGSLGLVWVTSAQRKKSLGPLVSIAYDAWHDRRHVVAWLETAGWGTPSVLGLGRGQGVTLDQFRAVVGLEQREIWLLHHEGVRTTVGEKNPRFLRLRRWRPDGTSAKLDLSWGLKGSARRIGAGWEGKRLWTVEAIETDDGSRFGAGSLRVLGVLGPEMQPRRWIALEDRELAPPPSVPDLAAGGERRRVAVEDGSELEAYFGNLHAHTDISVDGRMADGPPEQNLLALHDVANLDFVCLTDHVRRISPTQWRELWKWVELWNRPGRFVTLHGYEWSSATYGHKNVVFAGTELVLATPDGTPEDLWSRLESGRAITIPHHPSHARLEPTDWSFQDDELQRLVEVFQTRGNYEFDGAPLQRTKLEGWKFIEGHSVRAALEAGHHMGMIASPDHGGGLGLAGAWAAKLTRASIFEALHARRTFGTTGAKMTLWLEADGHHQGERISGISGPLTVRGVVHGTVGGLRLILVSDGREVHESRTDSAVGNVDWTWTPESEGESWLYLRAEQSDGHVGWTSPVWASPQ